MDLFYYLNEELNEPVPFKVSGKRYTFSIGDNNYLADFFNGDRYETFSPFDYKDTPVEGKLVEFGFGLKNKKEGVFILLTNTGHVGKVFSTLIEIIKDYASKNEVENMMFDASKTEPSRIKFYNLLYNNVSKLLPGFEKVKVTDRIASKVYVIKRKK